MKRPASHHRRNISMVSAREIQATNAADDHFTVGLAAATSAAAVASGDVTARGLHGDITHQLTDEDITALTTADIDDDDPGSQALECDVTPDPVLYAALASIPFRMVATSAPGEFPEARFKLSRERERVFDFFINLAVCNTVVISNDDGGSSGDDESASSTTDVSGSPSDSSGVSDVSVCVGGCGWG